MGQADAAVADGGLKQASLLQSCIQVNLERATSSCECATEWGRRLLAFHSLGIRGR